MDPDAVAVVSGGAWLSYGVLAERAGRLAGRLLGAGAGRETVVGLCLPGGADVVTGILAVWLAGAAYLPVDPGYPAERIAFMLADSRAAVVVGTSQLLEELRAGRIRTIAVDDRVAGAAAGGVAPMLAPGGAAGGQAAYGLYTAGATGGPRGAEGGGGGAGGVGGLWGGGGGGGGAGCAGRAVCAAAAGGDRFWEYGAVHQLGQWRGGGWAGAGGGD